MAEIHTVAGFAVVAIFALGWLWPLGAAIVRRGPGDRYWTWLATAQVVAGAQALVGVALLLLGRRPTTWLHIVYGLGPLLVLAVAHGLAREGMRVRRGARPFPPHVWFAFAAFIAFGLSLRAMMTGLGLG
ncbi:MAG: hypothetical protein KatS3mg013_1404 [Actinomycetota bacterium]|nr:MAG: hypothetical protein KatS3mg013_1404 [Actinomycetota bacterium]